MQIENDTFWEQVVIFLTFFAFVMFFTIITGITTSISKPIIISMLSEERAQLNNSTIFCTNETNKVLITTDDLRLTILKNKNIDYEEVQ